MVINSFKYFIEYKDHDYFGILCIKLPQRIGYVKPFNNNKTISLNVNNNMLLKSILKYRKESAVYGDNDKCIKTKVKLYGDKINTIFNVKIFQMKMRHTSVCN